ncbi:IS66 family transposase [Gluconobacter japonicus]|uniref:IS66 family transposase n=1 Tax=Gluconobacter japonicus TaxID=376620 RepID=UPI000784B11D|nr:transposase [Gluconobacter japonicus]
MTSHRLAACWAHTRRNFYELQQTGSPIATDALVQIRALYEIEAPLRRLPPNPKPFWTSTIDRALRRWDDLTRFVEDGLIELDTNPVDRAIRPVTLGRKNALFAGSEGALTDGPSWCH